MFHGYSIERETTHPRTHTHTHTHTHTQQDVCVPKLNVTPVIGDVDEKAQLSVLTNTPSFLSLSLSLHRPPLPPRSLISPFFLSVSSGKCVG